MPEDRKPPNFNRDPMLWLAVSFAGGILAASVPGFSLTATVVVTAIFALAAFIFRSHHSATLLIFIAFMVAGMSSALAEKQSVSPERLKVLYDNGTIRSGDPVEIEGVLLSSPEPSVESVLLKLRAEKLSYRGRELNVSGNVRLFLRVVDNVESDQRSDISDLKYGSRLKIVCTLDREDEFLNPGVISRKEMLDRLGVDAVGSIKSRLLIEKIADESLFIPLAWVYDQRARLIEDFRKNMSGPAAGVMIASLLGDKYFLDKDTADLFREGGTFHILVISGLHITFIGGLLLLFVRQIARNRWTQFIVTIAVLWAYTLAVGADVPVVRAAVMFTIVSYSYVIYRRASLLNSLGMSGLILLVWRPSDLLNPSFQLTFVSVAAIIVFAYPLVDTLRRIGSWTPSTVHPFPPNVPNWLKRFCETVYWNSRAWKYESKRHIWTANLIKTPFAADRLKSWIQRILQYLFEGILVSLIVQVCMLPLSVVYFHRVSVISILLNLWVGFFIALESFAAVIAVLINNVSSLLAAALFLVAETFNWLMLLLPRLFADNAWLSYRLPAYSGYGRTIYFLFFVPIIFLAIALNRWYPFELKRRSWMMRRSILTPATAVLIVLGAVIVLHPLSVEPPDGRLQVDFLDVGQGDAALVTFPDGRTLLVDGGGRMKYRAGDEDAESFEPDVQGIGETVVSQFLWHRGYSKVDFILATHADADHIQGLTDVAKNFEIGAALFGRPPIDDPDFAELAGVLRRRAIPIDLVERGDRFKFGDVSVEVLYPVASYDSNAGSDNDRSVVLRIVCGSRALLLTGDIERLAESELVNDGGTLNADVVKVPHHGSRTSSTLEFINAAAAKYAVISVGRTSPFGHPHQDVVDRWKAAGVDVVTTGRSGMVSISTDGRDLKTTSFLP